MGRFGPTGAVDVRGLEHSVADLSWGVLRGALGPSDGSAGARSNVPSALAVLRHAELYLPFPEEIDDAFYVLEHHAIDHGRLYPVAIAIVPFVLDMLRRRSIVSERLGDLLAEYASANATPEPEIRARLRTIISDHAPEIVRWLGRLDRAACALAIHVPALRPEMLAAIAEAERVAPEVLLALVELDDAPGRTVELALAMLERSGSAGPRSTAEGRCGDSVAGADSTDAARMCAAAFLARFGDHSPALATRIDAALPPSAPAALRNFVGKLWRPTIQRPVVAPKLYDAEVLFAGEKLVLVRAGSRSVTLRWAGARVERGDRIQVGITVHGEPKLAVITGDDGGVKIIDF